jgi:lipopolysaccharide export system protein LptA
MVITVVAMSCLLACYAVYVRVFGHLAGLEQLAESDGPPDLAAGIWPDTNQTPRQDYARLVAERVFGPDSWQAKADIALYRLQSGIIIYIADYENVGDQSLRLAPFSLVYAEQRKRGEPEPQIVTVQSNEAVLDFDRPIDAVVGQMASVKPIAGRLIGDVQIQADRATPDPDDDVLIYCDQPLEFKETDNKISTDGAVRVIAPGVVVTGTGGEVLMDLQQPPSRTSGLPMFGGVREVVLANQIQINMLAALDSGPAAPGARTKGGAPAEPKKTPISLACQGPFTYDMQDGTARFQRSVMMVREAADGRLDRLFCDELTALVEKVDTDSAATRDAGPKDLPLQFQSARATGRTVRIVSEGQGVEAMGTELTYDAGTGRSVLRGEPEVMVSQAGNVLHGRELRFTRAEAAHIVEAAGPGSMESRDSATGDVRLQAHWTGGARVEPQGEQQLLTLEGDVELAQPARVALRADRVRVWLAHESPQNGAPARHAAAEGSDWAPVRLEGAGGVIAQSAQLDIEAHDRLDMVIEAGSPGAAPAGPDARLATAAASDPARQGPPGNDRAANKRPPAQLQAETIRVRALRDTNRLTIAEVWTDGGVHLVQPPADPSGQPIVVRGESLYLKRLEQQNYLEVSGSPAHVELNDLKVDGARVTVDQPTGVAWVEGRGSMLLPSSTSFEGKKLDQPAELSIAWGRSMFFDGSVAEFGGGVEARQQDNVLRCDKLEAFLSERLNISAPKKPKSTAKIARLICTGGVQFDNATFADGRLEKAEHLEAANLEFSNADGQMNATGPGLVRSYTRGGPNALPALGNPAGKAQPDLAAASPNADQMYLREIRFAERMTANRTAQLANFFRHVEVTNAPVADENETVDPDNPPEGTLRLACEQLDVSTEKGEADKTFVLMVGRGNVDVEANEFSGRGDSITYNQQHDRLIFESRPGSFATLYRQPRAGQRPDETRARKIFFHRATGRIRIEGGLNGDFQEREADRRTSPRNEPTKQTRGTPRLTR